MLFIMLYRFSLRSPLSNMRRLEYNLHDLDKNEIFGTLPLLSFWNEDRGKWDHSDNRGLRSRFN